MSIKKDLKNFTIGSILTGVTIVPLLGLAHYGLKAISANEDTSSLKTAFQVAYGLKPQQEYKAYVTSYDRTWDPDFQEFEYDEHNEIETRKYPATPATTATIMLLGGALTMLNTRKR